MGWCLLVKMWYRGAAWSTIAVCLTRLEHRSCMHARMRRPLRMCSRRHCHLCGEPGYQQGHVGLFANVVLRCQLSWQYVAHNCNDGMAVCKYDAAGCWWKLCYYIPPIFTTGPTTQESISHSDMLCDSEQRTILVKFWSKLKSALLVTRGCQNSEVLWH